MHPNGLLQAALAAQASPQPQPQGVQIAAPLNDMQLVCLVAAQVGGSAQEAVDAALDIVAEAVAAMQAGELVRRLQQRAARRSLGN